MVTTVQELGQMLTATQARQQTALAEQLALGKTQVEEMTTVLRGLMTQMHDATGASVHQMAAALTAVAHDLSTRVSELGQQMTHTLSASAESAAGVAHTVIAQADSWSARSAAQLAQLLAQHQVDVERFQDVQATFGITLAGFKEALAQYANVTAHLRQIGMQMSSATQTMKDASIAMERAAQMAALQTERLDEANRRQEAVPQHIAQSMRQYQQVFGQVHQSASDLLTQMSEHLRHYTSTTQQGFDSMRQTADDHLRNAAERLGDTVRGLDDSLQDLTALLARSRVSGDSDGTS